MWSCLPAAQTAFAAQQKELGQLNAQVKESISRLKIVKAFCREDLMVQKFEGAYIYWYDFKFSAVCEVVYQALC